MNWREAAEEYHEIVCPVNHLGGKIEAAYLALELGGEAGELQNIIKKLWRGSHHDPDRLLTVDLPEELADVHILTYLLARHFNVDLEKAAEDKVKILFERINRDLPSE